MEVATKLVMFVAALVVALATGWGLGQLAGPHRPGATPPVATPVHNAPHTHPEFP
jgi:hypothetical protein